MHTQPHSQGRCEREVICSRLPFVQHKLLLFSRLERDPAPLFQSTALPQVRSSLRRFLLLISRVRLQRKLFLFLNTHFKKQELDVSLEKELWLPGHVIFLDQKSQGNRILEQPLKAHLFPLHLVSLKLVLDWRFYSQYPPAPHVVQHRAVLRRLGAHIEPLLRCSWRSALVCWEAWLNVEGEELQEHCMACQALVSVWVMVMEWCGLLSRWWGWMISWPPQAHECVSTSCKARPELWVAFRCQWGSSGEWCYRGCASLRNCSRGDWLCNKRQSGTHWARQDEEHLMGFQPRSQTVATGNCPAVPEMGSEKLVWNFFVKGLLLK